MTTATKEAFSIAKDALRLVGEFGTPPTPEVYEVWYRYVEGADKEMLDQMAHAVTESKSVSLELLKSIHEQYCTKHDDTGPTVGQSLMVELGNFQALISEQAVAGTSFGTSIGKASKVLAEEDPSSEKMAACVSSLAVETTKMQLQLDEMSQKLEAATQQVASLQEDLATSQRGMMTDHLTGVGNRRFFDTLIRNTIDNCDRNDDRIYLAMMDLDRFKLINDSFGHDAGDQVIQYFATAITKIRPDVSLARLGGDEFAALLRVKNREEALQFSEQLRDHFAKHNLTMRSSDQCIGKISFSIGVATLRPTDDTTSWFTRADKLLYQAKDLGRNRAVVEKGC